MIEFKCVNDNKMCAGYSNDKCISIENCQFKKEIISNFEYLTNKNNIRELAELLVQERSEPDFDYDIDDNVYECGTYYFYECSDGEQYYDFEQAVCNEIEWLKKEKEN